jgi:hypothetical protein
MSKQNIVVNSAIVSALNAKLYGGGQSAPKPRVRLTDERIATLTKIHGTETAFLNLVHNLHGAPNYRIKNAVESAIRGWIPEEIETKWLAKDAKETARKLTRFARRAPFNPIRATASA